MTAVEWLVEQLAKNGVLHSSDIAKAKEMEKEQRIKDIDFGHGNPSWVDINYEAYFELSE
jgi:hypothetical protein